MKPVKQYICLGEIAFYGHGELEEAVQYLRSWKKFTIKKLNRDCYSVKVIDEQWIDRGPEVCSMLSLYSSKALKLKVEVEFKFELDQVLE